MEYLRQFDMYPGEIRVRPSSIEPAYYTKVRLVIDLAADNSHVISRLYGTLPDGNIGLITALRSSTWSGAAQNGVIGDPDTVAWLYTRLGGCGCGDPIRALDVPLMTDTLVSELFPETVPA